MVHAAIAVLRLFMSPKGRSSSAMFLVLAPFFAFFGLLGTIAVWTTLDMDRQAKNLHIWQAIALMLSLYLVMTWPLAALAARRAHDVGLPGPFLAVPAVFLLPSTYWVFLHFLPSGGSIGDTEMMTVKVISLVIPAIALALLVFGLWPSQPGPNKYGPNPHEVTS